MSKLNLLAIIPARGGSKRLPHKNVHPFFGHPMLAYSVVAAVNSQLFERVVVSTDDPLIGEVGAWYGGEFLPRTAELAGDVISVADVAAHIVEQATELGQRPDAVCVLMPVCPLRRSFDIIDHWQVFEREQRQFQISVVPYRTVHPHWALGSDENGQGNWFFGEKYLVPSQQLGEAFCPSAAIWWARTDSLLAQRTFYGDSFHIQVIDANRGVDIDDKNDVDYAALLVRGLRERDGFSPLEPINKLPYPQGVGHSG